MLCKSSDKLKFQILRCLLSGETLPLCPSLRIIVQVDSTVNFYLMDKVFTFKVVHINGGGKQGEWQENFMQFHDLFHVKLIFWETVNYRTT